MTISIPAKANPRSVLAFHHTEDGVQGYKIRIGVEEVFVAESDADKLARYMLFTEPAVE